MPLRVLIIGQSEALGDSLARMLSSDGHAVTCIEGFGGDLKEVRSAKPDLIVLDVPSSVSGAVDMVPRLQRKSEMRHIPVIVVTDSPSLQYELLSVFDCIPIPVDRERLRDDVAILAGGAGRRGLVHKAGTLSEGDFRLFHDYLVTNSGLHFEGRNAKALERGIGQRMAALRIQSYRDYFAYLTSHGESRQELQKLLQYLTVGETYFFRYRAHFDALRMLLLARIADPGGKGFRIWSAGCSTGEEPYSIAITVMETLPDWRKRDIRIFATDINNRALRRAEEGVYRPWALRVTEKSQRDRYFDQAGDRFRVREEVKSLVHFSHLNLQTAVFPFLDDGFGEFDAIFCRNVMIYFTPATARGIIEKFAASLQPGGCLFLGHAEPLFPLSHGFERQTLGGSFYYRKRLSTGPSSPSRESRPASVRTSPRRPTRPAPVRLSPPPVTISAKSTEEDEEELYRKAKVFFDGEQFSEAARLLADVLRIRPDHGGALVTQGFIEANNGRFEDALAACRRALSVNDLMPEAYFLRGLVFDMLERPVEAVEEYRKAILLDMDFVMPHYNLGRLHLRLGRVKEGARELRNSLKILEQGEEDIVPYSGGVSRGVFLERLRRELRRA